MGRSYLFECAKCGYKAHVSGGADRGLNVWVQTICCRDCKKLYDAVVRMKMPSESPLKLSFRLRPLSSSKARFSTTPPPRFENVVSRLSPAASEHAHWVNFKIRCPVSALHRVHNWTHPGKCPRCGAFLDKNGLPFRLWE